MRLASERGLARVAFPAISAGAYGFPLDAAARIAVDVARGDWPGVTEVRFVLFTAETHAAFERALDDG